MKTLKESLLDDIDGQIEDQIAIADIWIKDNYDVQGEIKVYNGIVDINGDITIKNRTIKTLTNDLFKFGKVTGNFDCSNCTNLKTLKGAPRAVFGNFNCSHGDKLTTLEGAPKKNKTQFLLQ